MKKLLTVFASKRSIALTAVLAALSVVVSALFQFANTTAGAPRGLSILASAVLIGLLIAELVTYEIVVLRRVLTRVNGTHTYSKASRGSLRELSDASDNLQASLDVVDAKITEAQHILTSLMERSTPNTKDAARLRPTRVAYQPDGGPTQLIAGETSFGVDRRSEKTRTSADEAPQGFDEAKRELESEVHFTPNNNRFLTSTSTLFWTDDEASAVVVDVSGDTTQRIKGNEGETIEVAFRVYESGASSGSNKAGLFWARSVDKEGNFQDDQLLAKPNPKYGSYSYLDNRVVNDLSFKFVLPKGSAGFEIGVSPWDERLQVSRKFSLRKEAPNPKWVDERRLEDLVVAVVLDEFSLKSFGPEFHAVPVTPENWEQQFQKAKPDLFLCESAWSGADSDKREWKGQIYTSANFAAENRGALLEILSYCQRMAIPTVFWNKEDPTHFADEVHNFVDTAILFDFVFTTDAGSVDGYKQIHKHRDVYCLPFGVQPKMFNPIKTETRSTDIVFAGGWYENHEKRSKTMAQIFDSVLASGGQLKIYDRFYGTTDELHRFPARYQRYCKPPVPYERMDEVYKESWFGLTFNTVTSSETMFARRIFELMACNTAVISNYSIGIEKFFGNSVLYADTNPEELLALESPRIDAMRRKNLELVLREHTYEKRFKKIVDTVGLKYSEKGPAIAHVVRIESLDEAARASRALLKAVGSGDKGMILVGHSVDALSTATVFSKFNRNGIVVVSENLLLSNRAQVDGYLEDVGAMVIYGQVPTQLLPQTDIDWMKLHQTYVDDPIIKSQSGMEYQFTRWDNATPAVVCPENLSAVASKLANNDLITVYGV